MSAFACGPSPKEELPVTTGITHAAARSTADALGTDAQIAAFAEAANAAELDRARFALGRVESVRVRSYARQVIADDAMADRAGVATRSKVRIVTARDVAARLGRTTGRAFDRDWIDLEVDEGERVLRLLDERLIPAARDDELRRVLAGMRTNVHAHWRRALDLQLELMM